MVFYAAGSARRQLALLALIFTLLSINRLDGQSAEPVKVVVPVSVDAQSGGITVGGTLYSPTANPGMQMVVLRRQPDPSNPGKPVLLSNETFTDAGSANQFLQSVLANTPDAILIVSGVVNGDQGYGFAPADVASNLENFGATKDMEVYRQTWPTILIGNGGLAVGSAHELLVTDFSIPAPPQTMSGSFAVDSNGNYTFIQTDYLRYDIGVDGTIRIGSQTYAAPNPCSGPNSFSVVVVKRENPEQLVDYKIYCTAESNQALASMAQYLSGFQGYVYMVFIASSGRPIPANWSFGANGDPRVSPLAKAIANLGGYWETVAYLTPKDTYSLVAAGTSPDGSTIDRRKVREASSIYLLNNPTAVQYATGEVHGVLARGLRNNFYAPINADPTGIANLGLYQVLGQTPVPFPHPANADELAAFQSISGMLCQNPSCNVRNQYPDLNVDISSYLTLVEAMKDPSGADCDASNPETPFCVVRQQMLLELKYVAQIRQLSSNVQTLWLASGDVSITKLLATYSSLQNSLNPPASATSGSLVDPIVSALLGLLSFVPDVGPVFGIASTFFSLGESLTTDSQGNPAISLTTTLANLESQATTLFTAQASTAGTQFQLIYQDWGKIEAVGSALLAANEGSPWFWTANTTPQILNAMAPAVEQAYYRSFLSALYAVGSYYPTGWGSVPFGQQPILLQPASYGASFEGDRDPQQVYRIFSGDFGYVPYSYPSDPDNIVLGGGLTSPTSTLLSDGQWLGVSLQSTPPYNGYEWKYEPPPTDVLTHLFSPVSDGGLNVYRPAFFEGWPLPHVQCDASDPSGDGQYSGTGCPWSSAAPSIESLPAPLTKVSMRVHLPGNKLSPSGPTEVRLLVTNSGSGVARSIAVNRVLIKTLAGSGQATLVNTDLPLRTGPLAPGGITAFTVLVNIPSTIRKLVFTTIGELDSGKATADRFSQQQVVIVSN